MRRRLTPQEFIATLRAIPERSHILFDGEVRAGVLTGYYRHSEHLGRSIKIVLQGGQVLLQLRTPDWISAEIPTFGAVEAIRDGAIWLETGQWPDGPVYPRQSDSDGCGGKSRVGDSDGPARAGEGL